MPTSYITWPGRILGSALFVAAEAGNTLGRAANRPIPTAVALPNSARLKRDDIWLSLRSGRGCMGSCLWAPDAGDQAGYVRWTDTISDRRRACDWGFALGR